MSQPSKASKFAALKILLAVLLVILAAFAGLILFLTLTEYKPEDVETVSVTHRADQVLSQGDTLSIVSWNTGYCALGDNADFFMDGGSMVQTASKERVEENLADIISRIEGLNPDLLFLQETDIHSSRSHRINEVERITKALPAYDWGFATNFKVAFVPYPIPPIGQVHSGILTLSRYPISEAERIQLPCPFSWPVRMANLRRCLLISRIPLAGTDRELVAVNLHLEAYDSGEGKIAQTAMLRSYLDAEIAKGNYVIAGGDFNQLFSSADSSAYPVYEGKWQPGIIDVSDFSEDMIFTMDTAIPSCRSLDQPYVGADLSHFQYYLIDGFILSSNIRVESVETQDFQFHASDHNPVRIEITLMP